MVRAEGLEPPQQMPPEPKSGVSTNSTMPAYTIILYKEKKKMLRPWDTNVHQKFFL